MYYIIDLFVKLASQSKRKEASPFLFFFNSKSSLAFHFIIYFIIYLLITTTIHYCYNNN